MDTNQRQLDSQEASSMLYRDRQFTFNNKQSFENQKGPAANHNNSQQYAFQEDDSVMPNTTKNSFNQSNIIGGNSEKMTSAQSSQRHQAMGMQSMMQSSVHVPEQPLEQFGQMIKIVLVGESGVGKTALVHRYMKNTMPPDSLRSTVAVEFGTRKIVLKHRPYKVQVVLWDTAGQERFKSLTTHHYQGAHGALLCFDVTSAKSFERIQTWVDELTQNTPIGCKTALVTNKCDLAFREVPEEEVRSFAHQNNLLYYETSSWWNRDDDELVSNAGCRGGIGVLIDSMVEEIIDDIVMERLSNVHNTLGQSPSEYQGTRSPKGREIPFSVWDKQKSQVGGIRLGQQRNLYEVEEENDQSGCGC